MTFKLLSILILHFWREKVFVPFDILYATLYSITTFEYHYIIDAFLRLTSGFVNPRTVIITEVSRGEHHLQGFTNHGVNRKRMHHLFCYMTLSFFS